jgi:hypothetical protein
MGEGGGGMEGHVKHYHHGYPNVEQCKGMLT